jgi:hypothetical protein
VPSKEAFAHGSRDSRAHLSGDRTSQRVPSEDAFEPRTPDHSPPRSKDEAGEL